MRSARILGEEGKSNVYHVTNRCINKEFFLKDSGDKEHLVFLMLRHAKVMGIEVLTFCIMDNHFHMLLRVPDREKRLENLADDEAIRRFQPVYPGERWNAIIGEWQQVIESESPSWRREFAGKFRNRLFRLDKFVSELKGMFAVYFNQKYDRTGTIWGDRFHSVLVEDEPEIMRLMAAYIDLNPVRAGLVKDPKEYRWCGYAKALGGSLVCQKGLLSLYRGEHDFAWAEFAQMYRLWLFGKKISISESEKDRVLHVEEGELSESELAKHRLRYFSEGLAIGSADFIEQTYRAAKKLMGTKREKGARKPFHEAHQDFRTLKSVRSQTDIA